MIIDKLKCSIDVKSFLVDRDLSETMQVIQETMEKDDVKDGNISSELMKALLLSDDSISVSGVRAQVGSDVMSDVEMFEGYKGGGNENDSSTSVIGTIKQTHTNGGFAYLTRMLSAPISDVPTLEARKSTVAFFTDRLDIDITPRLERLQRSEGAIAWIFNSNRDELANLYDMVYFTSWFTRPFNKSGKALTSYNIYRILASPAIGILSPICYIIIPFIILRKQMGVSIPFFTYVKYMIQMMFASDALLLPSSLSPLKYLSFAFTLIFYFQGVFNSIELATAVNRICKLITGKVNGFITFVKASNELNKLFGSKLSPFFDAPSDDAKINTFEEIVIPSEYSWFSNFGKQLSIFKRIDIDAYRGIINRAYMIDAITSIAKLVKTHSYSFADFSTHPRPTVSFQGLWHPCLDPNKVVTNDLLLGGDEETSRICNAVLTGPNAGGKSTLIKSLLLNTLFAQTCTVTCCKHAYIRPFNLINSQINIPDCKGKESLFEAEMYRSKTNLDALSSLDPSHTALIVMDEIFNSTNPVEGIAGAYAIAKHMAAHPNATCVITTHYLYLTKLAKEFPDRFTNYRMNVVVDAGSGTITYPYKMSKGVSRQYIALELLRKNGFDTDLIDDAIAIKTRLTTPTHAPVTHPKPENKTPEEEEDSALKNE